MKTSKKSSSLQNITLSADKELIQQARARAKAAKTTLNQEFRNWLRQFSRYKKDKGWYSKFMQQFDKIDSGRKFSREDFYSDN